MAFRIDRGTLRPPRRLDNGMMCADGVLTRAGVFEYLNADGSLRREYRPPEEVFRADSVASFHMKPFTDGHPPGLVTSKNAREYAVGAVGQDVRRDGEMLAGSIIVYDEGTISKMEGGQVYLSCGYEVDLDPTPGTAPDGQRYDAIQRNIRGNHVALVGQARAGDIARVRMDSVDDMAVMKVDGGPGSGPSGGGGKGGSSFKERIAKETDIASLEQEAEILEGASTSSRGSAEGSATLKDQAKAVRERISALKSGDGGKPGDLKPGEATVKGSDKDGWTATVRNEQGKLSIKTFSTKREAVDHVTSKGVDKIQGHVSPAEQKQKDEERRASTGARHPIAPREDNSTKELGMNPTLEEQKKAMEAALVRASSEQLRADKATADLSEMKVRADKAEGELASVRERLVSLEKLRQDEKPEEKQALINGQAAKIAALEKVRTDESAAFPIKLREAVKARVALEAAAGLVLSGQRLDDLEDRQIMCEVVQKITGVVIPEDKSADYVRARFDAAVEGFSNGAKAIDALRGARLTEERNDENVDRRSPRDKMIERNQTAWKKGA